MEWQSPVYKKAFNMIDRSTMWRIMRHYVIPLKIVSIIHSLYDGMTCQVIHNNDLSSPFTVTTGVRAKTLQDLDFADDIGLLSHYFKHIQEKSQRLSKVALQTGLEINTQKTKNIRVNTATNTLI